MEGTIFTLIPSIVTIILIFITKRLIESLGVGVIVGALIANNWSVPGSISTIWTNAVGVFKDQYWLFGFVLFIGMMTALIHTLGGSQAFSNWAYKYVKSRFMGQLITMLLGFVFYFDDTCSVFLRARIVAPMNDKLRVSRSKLSFLIHSTAAPIIMLIPFSAIGAVVLATLNKTMVASGFTQYSSFSAFVLSLFTNYYVLSMIIMIFVVAYFGIDIGQMRHDEKRAIEEGIMFDDSQKSTAAVEESKLPTRDDGRVSDLLGPVGLLILGIVVATLYYTFKKIDGAITFTTVIANLDVSKSLLVGGFLGAGLAVIKMVRRKAPADLIVKASLTGMKTTGISILILFMALLTTEILKSLKIGTFLATLFSAGTNIAWLPILIFVIAMGMSYGTGTTLGTVTLLIPVGLELAAIVDPTYLMPVLGAVFSGALFGEHNSPLSDTSILSAAGSGIETLDHLRTQLPYALSCVAVSVVGFAILGITNNRPISLAVVLILEAAILYYLYKKYGLVANEKREASQSS